MIFRLIDKLARSDISDGLYYTIAGVVAFVVSMSIGTILILILGALGVSA